MTIGKNIAAKRKERSWTQKQLAEVLNVSDKTISSWENERTYPDIVMLIQLSDTFNLSLDKLIREDLKMVKEFDYAIKNWRKMGEVEEGI
ncbi:XRE family transcriptional regulator (fragment) [Carnobacterium maltaromaticum]